MSKKQKKRGFFIPQGCPIIGQNIFINEVCFDTKHNYLNKFTNKVFLSQKNTYLNRTQKK